MTVLLVAKFRSSTAELVGSQSRGAIIASRGREGTDAMLRAGDRMRRRMRMHPMSWAQPGDQSTGSVIRSAATTLAADRLAGKVPEPLMVAARDRLAPAASRADQPATDPASDPRAALARAWDLHHAAVAAAVVSSPDPTATRLAAALAAQETHLQVLGQRLGTSDPPVPAPRDAGRDGGPARLAWETEDAIDVAENAEARSRHLPSWSSRQRAALVYLIVALVVSVLPAVGLVGSSELGSLVLVVAQCLALPLLSLAAGAIAVGPLFRPWLGGPVPRHPVIGTWTVLAVHIGTGLAAVLVHALT